jgi:hypothetical protein
MLQIKNIVNLFKGKSFSLAMYHSSLELEGVEYNPFIPLPSAILLIALIFCPWDKVLEDMSMTVGY